MWLVAVSLCLAVTTLSGCAPASVSDASGSGGTPVSDAPSTDSAARLNGEPVDSAGAPPRSSFEYNVSEASPLRINVDAQSSYTIPLARGEQRRQGVAAVSSSGDAVLDVARVAQSTDGITLTQSHVVVRDRQSGDRASTEPVPRGRRVTQLAGAAATNRYVAWMETPSTSLNRSPWRLYVFDRRDERTSLVAEARRIDGHAPPPVPNSTGPTIAGGRVYWAQVDAWPDGRRYPLVNLYSAPAGGAGQPRLEARQAAAPVATPQGLFFLRTYELHPATPRHRVAISRVTPRGHRSIVARGSLPQGGVPELAAAGRRVAWTVSGRRDTVTLKNWRSKHRSHLVGAVQQCFATPSLTRRLLIWSDGACSNTSPLAGYVFDLQQKRLRSLGNEAGLNGTAAAGRWFMWQEGRRHREYPHDVAFKIARLP